MDKLLKNPSLLKWLLLLITLALGGWVLITNTHLGECTSGSLRGITYALFIKSNSLERGALVRGDIVLIRNHPTRYFQNLSYTKRIIGLPGDKIERVGDVLYAHGYSLPFLRAGQDGRPLTPLEAKHVPPGYMFVAGDHPRSFDSRYEEFGLVACENIWGKAVLTW